MPMHHRLVAILGQIRLDLAQLLGPEEIHAACRAENHSWRQRKLGPVQTIHLFILQVLHGNTAMKHLPRLAGETFTDSAYCAARMRLPLGVFQRLLRRVAELLVPPRQDPSDEDGRWLGRHRVFLEDGSSYSMPDTPELRKHFGVPGNQPPGCGFPTAHLLALFHAATGAMKEVFAAPLRTHDMSQTPLVHPALKPGDVVVCDRGFCSYAHMASLFVREVFGLFRMHQKQIVDFTPHRPHALPGDRRTVSKGKPRSRWLRRLGVLDQLVEWFKPTAKPDWMSADEYAQLPDSLVVRELRYRVACKGFRTKEVTLVTTLLDAEFYPVEALAELYRQRWEAEGHLKELKQTLKLDILKSETVDGVLKEMTMIALVYNLVRAVLVDAARRQGVEVRRLSFIDALRWLETARAGDGLPTIVVNPDRPGRVEPRVRKRRPKEYPVMKRPRSVLRAELSGAATAA